jgi:acyl carrier protein
MEDQDTLNKVQEIRAWFGTRKPNLPELELDFDLIQNRVLDSLIYIEFIFFLEEFSGYELQSHAEDANRFRTLRSICDNVLSGKGLERVA